MVSGPKKECVYLPVLCVDGLKFNHGLTFVVCEEVCGRDSEAFWGYLSNYFCVEVV